MENEEPRKPIYISREEKLELLGMFNINANTGEVYHSSIRTKQKRIGKNTITDIHHEKTTLGNIYNIEE